MSSIYGKKVPVIIRFSVLVKMKRFPSNTTLRPEENVCNNRQGRGEGEQGEDGEKGASR